MIQFLLYLVIFFIVAYVSLLWANGGSLIETISPAVEAQLASNTSDTNITIGKGTPLPANAYMHASSQTQQLDSNQEQNDQQQQGMQQQGQEQGGYHTHYTEGGGQFTHTHHPHPHSHQFNPSRDLGRQYPSYYPTDYRQDRPMYQGYYPNYYRGNNYQAPYYSQGGYGYPNTQRQHFAHGYQPYYGKGGIAPTPTTNNVKLRNLQNWVTRWF